MLTLFYSTTHFRSQYFDLSFSPTIPSEGLGPYTFMTRIPPMAPKWQSILFPFPPVLWACIGCSYFIFGAVALVKLRATPFEVFNWMTCVMTGRGNGNIRPSLFSPCSGNCTQGILNKFPKQFPVFPL